MKKNEDPCIEVCAFDGRTGFCTGCGRTLAEARDWRRMTPFRRDALRRELPRRLGKLARQASS